MKCRATWFGLVTIALFVAAEPARAELLAPAPITDDLIKQAKAEGKVVFYTSVELVLAEDLSKMFQEKYSGISVQVERTGSERVFQRIGQEYAANIHSVDVVNSSDASHFIYWKRNGMLQPFLSPEMVENYPASSLDPDGAYAPW